MATYIDQKAEDSASADGQLGFQAMAVRKATPANTSDTDGDFEFLQISAGRLWTSTVLEASSVNIGDVDVLTLPGDVESDIDQIRDQIDLITPDIEEIRVDADAIRIAVEIMDDWDESDRAKVNLVVGQAGITAAAGAVAANTPRITHASDDPVTVSVQIMDDWDESDRAKVNPIVGIAGVAAGSGASSTATQRIIAATDSPDVTSLQLIDDIVHSGDAVLSKYAVIGAVLDDVATVAVTENQAQSLRMSTRRALLVEGVASGTALNVSLAAETTKVIGTVNIAASQTIAVTNTGTFAVQAAGTVAHDGVGTSTNPLAIGGYASAAAPSDVSNDGDVVRAWNLRNGARAVVLTAAGALISASSNALDVNLKTSNLANQSVNVAQINGVTPLMGSGNTGTGSPRVTIATDQVALTTAGVFSVKIDQTTDGTTNKVAATQATASNLNAQVVGSIAHDGVDSGNPVKIGMRAIAHGTNPTAVAAADRTDWLANRAGVPFVIGGHPNIQTVEFSRTGSGTDTALITVSSGTKICITQISAVLSAATTVNIGVRVGFGTTAQSTAPTNGNTAVGTVLTHPKIAPGSGIVLGNGSGIIAVGTDDQDLRCTNDSPTSGELRILVSYFTIES